MRGSGVALVSICAEDERFGHELLIRFAHKYSRPRLGNSFALLMLPAPFESLIPNKTPIFDTYGNGIKNHRCGG